MNENIYNFGLDDLADLEKWRKENPVEIPKHIIQLRDRRKAEYLNPNLSREKWLQLNEVHKRMMEGNTEDDLYYRLAVLKGMFSQGDDGVMSEIGELEKALRKCWCGSGKMYKNCHGK